MVTEYRTYVQGEDIILQEDLVKKFRKPINTGMNKPMGGFWGCKGTEWKRWCKAENYPCGKTYVKWYLADGAKVLRIRHTNDFCDLVERYAFNMGGVMSIDFERIAETYDAVEVLPRALAELRLPFDIKNERFNRLPQYIRAMGLYTWDVPSIVALKPDKIRYVGG